MTLGTVMKTWPCVLVSTSLMFLLLTSLSLVLFTKRLPWNECSRGLVSRTGRPWTPEEMRDTSGDLLRPPPVQQTTWTWFRPVVSYPAGRVWKDDWHLGLPFIWFAYRQVANGCGDAWRMYTGVYAGALLVDLISAVILSGGGYWLFRKRFSHRRVAQSHAGR